MTDSRLHPRRRVLHVAAAAAASIALPLRAQSGFPSGPLRIIVSVPAGGAADVGARALGIVLERNLKQPVVVENRTGGNFQIAWQGLQSFPADGHTLLHIFNTFPAVHAVQKLFDMERQSMAITEVGSTPIVVLVKGDSPYKTIGDLLTYARANPGKVNYSTTGVGTFEHLKMAQFEKAGGFKGLAVPYRGGPDAAKALLGGEITFMGMAPGIFAKQFAPTGQVRVLATMGATRWKDFPDVPTLAESGVNITPASYWGGYVVRSGTAPDIVQRLYREVSAAAMDPSVVEKIAASGQVAHVSKSPDDFRQFLASEMSWIAEAAKGLDLKG
jgi:tripartite-type tricarboxylate transporter receptor subunit TctC